MTMVSGRVQSSRLVHRIGAFLNHCIMTKKKVALMHLFDAQSRKSTIFLQKVEDSLSVKIEPFENY